MCNHCADTFIKYWDTTIAMWNISELASNTSHTKAEMADQVWSEAFGGALDILPNIERKEQESVQQSHFRSQFVLWHFNLPIEMQIGALMRRTDIPHLRPILNTLKLQT